MISVEACLLPSSAAPRDLLASHVHNALRGTKTVREGMCLDLNTDPVLAANLRHVRVSDVPDGVADGALAPASVYVHHIFEDEAAEEAADDDDAESSVAFQMWTLPSVEFDGLWETLLYEEEIKARLLRYVSTAMRFSEIGVDPRVIAWNRVVLLHGPPGTGKTSLCKGLAQKLAIQMSHKYAQGHLIEVNAHSLFSKWFSESGKMVMGMFTKIREILEVRDLTPERGRRASGLIGSLPRKCPLPQSA